MSNGSGAAGASAGRAAVNPNATATAAAGPSLAAASGTSIPGKQMYEMYGTSSTNAMHEMYRC